jgi:hypothetical protein
MALYRSLVLPRQTGLLNTLKTITKGFQILEWMKTFEGQSVTVSIFNGYDVQYRQKA